jgi:hypothetical protein
MSIVTKNTSVLNYDKVTEAIIRRFGSITPESVLAHITVPLPAGFTSWPSGVRSKSIASADRPLCIPSFGPFVIVNGPPPKGSLRPEWAPSVGEIPGESMVTTMTRKITINTDEPYRQCGFWHQWFIVNLQLAFYTEATVGQTTISFFTVCIGIATCI